jgi:peptide/nickel transport system substrate-binding protein
MLASGSTAAAPVSAARSSGGAIRFGLEAETTGGFCIPQAQLTPAGIQVAAALYDTLTAPNTDGEYVPNLAEEVTPNADFTEWTIRLRDGISFHNGERFDADAVAKNFDAWKRGRLFQFSFSNMGNVTKVDDLTLRIAMTTPWAAFPAYLFSQGRAGIVAPAQLDDPECASHPIGTGPFRFESWRVNEALTVVKNPDYWKHTTNGRALPCLDKITFVPVPDSATRQTQLIGRDLDILQTFSAQAIDQLEDASGIDVVYDAKGNRETRYYLVNAAKPPFDDPQARLALAYALDPEAINRIRNKGFFDLAHGIIDSNSPGYLKRGTFPEHDLKRARRLVEQVKAAHDGAFDVTFATTTDSDNVAEGELLVSQARAAGMDATMTNFDQSSSVNQLLAGSFSVVLMRNFHSDPAYGDFGNYIWFSKGSLVNFSRFDDPNVQRALDAGRVSVDPATLVSAYEDFSRAMEDGLYAIPAWYNTRALASRGLRGQSGAPLPDGSKPLAVAGRFPVDALCEG